MKIFFKRATAENEKVVDGLNLHEIKNDIIGDYEGEFKMVVALTIVEYVRKTYMRIRIIKEYEVLINAIGMHYN